MEKTTATQHNTYTTTLTRRTNDDALLAYERINLVMDSASLSRLRDVTRLTGFYASPSPKTGVYV